MIEPLCLQCGKPIKHTKVKTKTVCQCHGDSDELWLKINEHVDAWFDLYDRAFYKSARADQLKESLYENLKGRGIRVYG